MLKVPRRRGSDRADVPAFQGAQNFIQNLQRLLPALPFGGGAQQIFLRDHLENGTDVLRHAAVDKHEAISQRLARGRWRVFGVEDAMTRH